MYNPSTKIGDVWWMLCTPKHSQILGPFLTKFCVNADNLKATIALCAFGFPDNNQTQVYNQCNDICSGDNASMQTTLGNSMDDNKTTLQYNSCKK